LYQKQRGARVSRDGIEHRAARVSSVTGISTLISVGFQLISVPICLHYWGKESYGSWLALYAVFMLVRSLDTGFVSYVGNKLNYLYHQDQNTLREHLASSITGIAIIGALQLSIGVAAMFSDNIVLLLGVSSDPATDHRSSLALLVLIGTWALSGSYFGIVHRLLIPTGMMYQAAWWSMGFQVSQFTGIILAAMLHFDMLQTSLLFVFIQFSIYLASAIYIRQKLPAYYPWWRGGRPRTGIKDLGRSMWLTASNLIQQGSLNGTVILVSALSGPAAVPVFTTVRTLANLWTNVTNVLTTPLLPEVVRYHAKGEGRKLVTVNEAYWVLVGTVVNLGILIIYPLIEPMYGYWTAHVVVFDKALLCLLLASVVVSNVGGLISLYLNGINSLRVVLAASVVRGTLGLGVGSFLFYHFGLAGFGMGILGGEILVLLMMGRYFVKRELSKQGVSMPLRSLAPITISTASVLLFLMSDGFGFQLTKYFYSVALLGVVGAALWGWRELESGVRSRLVYMISNLFFRKDIV
jgi:O-antigen/teichoic acid export membrane protein